MTIKTREQIAQEYGVCRKTLRKWMAITTYNFPRHLTPSWQKLIYEEFDYPLEVDEQIYEGIRLPRAYRQFFQLGYSELNSNGNSPSALV